MAKRKSFLLRMPPDLHAEIERWAAEELRSVNAQIEFILRDAVRRQRGGRSAAQTDSREKDPPPEQPEDEQR